MNQQLISRYLRILRRQHGFTQESLSRELNVSRQAVSKWETGGSIPDLDVLLKLSKLYQITINAILEPPIAPAVIRDFEQLPQLPPARLKMVLAAFSKSDIVIASMGASPDINRLLAEILPEINFRMEQMNAGPIRVEDVEAVQAQIVGMANVIDEG